CPPSRTASRPPAHRTDPPAAPPPGQWPGWEPRRPAAGRRPGRPASPSGPPPPARPSTTLPSGKPPHDRLVDLLGDFPVLIHQLVGLAVHGLGIGPVGHALGVYLHVETGAVQ